MTRPRVARRPYRPLHTFSTDSIADYARDLPPGESSKCDFFLSASQRPNAMSYIRKMFEAHPVNPSSDHVTAIECITACYSCSEACNACADACLGEKNVAEMVSCIRDCNDCSDVCLATARIISRFTRTDFNLAGAQLRACIQACQSCGAICQKHGERMEHCRVCAEACHDCAEACQALLAEK